jgi:hypothetical protein
MQWLHGLRTFTLALAFGALREVWMVTRWAFALCNRLCGALTSVVHSIRVRAGSGGRTVDPGGASALVLLLVCSRVLQTRNREPS